MDYGYTNRLLPVWRVRFARDDGLAVYVSTVDDRLATISDTRKRIFQQTFHAVHSWGWLPAPLRNGWINALLAGVAFTTLAAMPVLKFSEDYGFLFKRLPVWRVAQDDTQHTALYLDTASERRAARITDGDRTSGALFAYAHKWEWVTPLAGKDWRDGLSATFALLLIGVALGGTWLRRPRD